ncbi:MAG: hypothetical protein Q9220_000181 [cf. Caloplaca sp. 1 TL-2023]
MTIAEELRSRNFSIYGQWFVKSFLRSHRYIFNTRLNLRESIFPPNPGYLPMSRDLVISSREKKRLQQSSIGIICIFLCIALGIANFFNYPIIIVFSIICLYVMSPRTPMRVLSIDQFVRISGLVLIFVEVPLLLRICPTSQKFDVFIRRFTTNYMRAAMYGTMSLVQWLTLVTHHTTSLIAAAVVLLAAAVCYLIAGLKGQGFVGSKTLGGQGVAQMIV